MAADLTIPRLTPQLTPHLDLAPFVEWPVPTRAAYHQVATRVTLIERRGDPRYLTLNFASNHRRGNRSINNRRSLMIRKKLASRNSPCSLSRRRNRSRRALACAVIVLVAGIFSSARGVVESANAASK